MDGTFGAHGSDATATASGDVPIAVEAADEAGLIRAAITALLAAALPGWRPQPGDADRSVPIRAEAAGLPEVVADLFGAAIDQIEGVGIAVGGVEIDGVLRSDVGLIAWGRLTVAEGAPAMPRRVAVSSGALSEHAGGLRLELGLAEVAA